MTGLQAFRTYSCFEFERLVGFIKYGGKQFSWPNCGIIGLLAGHAQGRLSLYYKDMAVAYPKQDLGTVMLDPVQCGVRAEFWVAVDGVPVEYENLFFVDSLKIGGAAGSRHSRQEISERIYGHLIRNKRIHFLKQSNPIVCAGCMGPVDYDTGSG